MNGRGACTAKVTWLENTCLEANRGVEWDWLNWKRSVTMAPATERTSMDDMALIYKQACGGFRCTGQTVTPAQLIAAAQVKYGALSPRYLRFIADVNAYGANH